MKREVEEVEEVGDEASAALASAVETTNSGTELARGALVNIVTLLAANLRGIFTFLVARLLGQATLGTFGIAWSTTDLLSKFGLVRDGHEHDRAGRGA